MKINLIIFCLLFAVCAQAQAQNDTLVELNPEKYVSEKGATFHVYDSLGVFVAGRLIFGEGKTKSCFLPAGKYFLDIIDRAKDLSVKRITLTVILK